jgi:hypothetical protein
MSLEEKSSNIIQEEIEENKNDEGCIINMSNEYIRKESPNRKIEDIFEEYLGEEPIQEENRDQNQDGEQDEEEIEVDEDGENFNPNPNKPKSNKLKNKIRKKFEENIRKYILNKEGGNPENLNLDSIGASEGIFGYSKLKKLKKKSEVIKEKQIAKKVSMGFFDVEAELGSDNEEHDDIIKKITDSDREDDENLDGDLKDLIEDDENLDEEGELLQKKFFDDMLERDRAQVKRVISGPQQEKEKVTKIKRNRSENEEEDDDEMNLEMRMRKFKSSQEDEETQDPQFQLKSLYRNYKSLEKKISENLDENQNDELTEMYQSMESNMMKKIAEQEKDHIKLLINRMKENEKILENVINLNSNNGNEFDGKNKNAFLNKGNIANSAVTSTVTSKLAPKMNHRNSFLHAMKNDKYFVKTENSLTDLSLKNQGSFDGNSNISASASNSAVIPEVKKGFQILGANKANINMNLNSNKSSNLSALFTRSSKNRHNEMSTSSVPKNKDMTSSLFTPSK